MLQIAAGHPGAPGIKLLGVAAAFVISWPRGAALRSQGVKVTSGSSPAWRHPKFLQLFSLCDRASCCSIPCFAPSPGLAKGSRVPKKGRAFLLPCTQVARQPAAGLSPTVGSATGSCFIPTHPLPSHQLPQAAACERSASLRLCGRMELLGLTQYSRHLPGCLPAAFTPRCSLLALSRAVPKSPAGAAEPGASTRSTGAGYSPRLTL